MTDNGRNRKALIPAAINVFLMFALAGMPKDSMYIYFETQRYISFNSEQVFYLVLSDVTLKDKSGNEVHYEEGAKISYNRISSEIDRGLNPEEYGKDGVTVDSHVFSSSVFKDTSKFRNITAQVFEEEQEKIRKDKAEGPKRYCKKLFRDVFWFVYPFDGTNAYVFHLISGLIFAFVSVVTGVTLYLVNPEKAESICKILISIKLLLYIIIFLLIKL